MRCKHNHCIKSEARRMHMSVVITCLNVTVVVAEVGCQTIVVVDGILSMVCCKLLQRIQDTFVTLQDKIHGNKLRVWISLLLSEWPKLYGVLAIRNSESSRVEYSVE